MFDPEIVVVDVGDGDDCVAGRVDAFGAEGFVDDGGSFVVGERVFWGSG